MVKLAAWLKRHRFLLSVLVVYFIIGIGLLGWYRHQLNPDAVSYISIAHKYAAGNFQDAVNAYWGPLLSWLLVPFALLHLSMQTGAKLIALAAGGLIIVLAWRLAAQLKVEPLMRQILMLVLMPFCWYWALPSPITPDLLVVAAFLAYLYVLGSEFKTPWAKPVLVGVIGALGFFAKAFFLPFFIAHLIVWTVIRIRKQPGSQRRPIILSNVLSLAVAALLILPWGIALGAKYHRPILSSSSTYNLRTLSPTQPGQPIDNIGLWPPPNSTALSAWEDPTYLPTPNWSPLKSFHDFHYYLGVVVENLRVIGLIFLTFSVFSLAILLWVLLTALDSRLSKRQPDLKLVLSAIIVYLIGYILTIREERYFWPVFAITLVLAAGICSDFWRRQGRRASTIFALAVIAVSFLLVPLTKLNSQRNIDLGVKQSADSLKVYLKPGSRIASNSFDSIKYCYYWQLPCYGPFKPGASDAFNAEQLQKYKITDVLILTADQVTQKPAYLGNYHEQPTGDAATQLYILNPAPKT